MREIQLTQGKVAWVDDEDFERVNQFKWCAHKSARTFYSERMFNFVYGRKMVGMHRFIMGNPVGMFVDHIDHNGLNNQKSNLRICTCKENTRNRIPIINKTSMYKGVSWDKVNGRWKATIRNNGIHVHTKRFKLEIDAALQYDEWAKDIFKEFAILNFG